MLGASIALTTASLSTSHMRAILRFTGSHHAVRAQHDRVGLDADGPQRRHGVLRGLRLELARRADVRHERHVEEEDVVPAELVAHLAGRLEEGLRLDVADGAADLGDDDVDVLTGLGAHARLDLVGDVRDDLDRVAEVLAAPLARDHLGVDLAGRDVRGGFEVDVEEALVVADVEVRLGAVLGDEHLAVLERVHRPGVDVEVRVELLHGDAQAARAEQTTEAGRREALAERGGDAAGDEDVRGAVLGTSARGVEAGGGPVQVICHGTPS